MINFYTFPLWYQSLLLFAEHKEDVEDTYFLYIYIYIYIHTHIYIHTVFWQTNYQEMYYSLQDTESMQVYYVLEKISDF